MKHEEHRQISWESTDAAFPWDPLQYPFEAPSRSFRWIAGRTEPLSSSVHVDELTTQRHAVLAIGSNASPANSTESLVIDDLWIQHRQMDVSPYSPRSRTRSMLSTRSSGSAWRVPATLLETHERALMSSVTWLTSVQLERMNETEGLGHSYQLRRITGVRSHGEEVGRGHELCHCRGCISFRWQSSWACQYLCPWLFVATRDAAPGVGSPFCRHGLWHEWQDTFGPRARLSYLAGEGRVAPRFQSPYGDTLILVAWSQSSMPDDSEPPSADLQ